MLGVRYGVAGMAGFLAGRWLDSSAELTTMISWIAPPHFYQVGRLIVFYIGSDQPTLDLLTAVLGPQFAGR